MTDFSFSSSEPLVYPDNEAVNLRFPLAEVSVDVVGAMPLPTLQALVTDPTYEEQLEVAGAMPLPTMRAGVGTRVEQYTHPTQDGNGDPILFMWNRGAQSAHLEFSAINGPPEPNMLSAVGKLPPPTLIVGLSGTNEVNVSGTLPQLQLQASVLRDETFDVVGVMPGLTLIAEARYSTNTQRPTVGKTDAAHQVASKLQNGQTTGHQDAPSAPTGWQSFFQRVTGGHQPVVHKLPNVLQKRPVNQTGVFQAGTKLRNASLYSQQDATPLDKDRTSLFQNATAARDDTFFRHQDGTRVHQRRDATHEEASPMPHVRSAEMWQLASAILKGWAPRHQDAMVPPIGISLVPPPPGPGEPCYTPSGNLVFSTLWTGNTNLVFICDGYTPPPPPPPGETIVVPVQRVYIVINSASLRRIADNAIIPTYSLSLSLDASSWTWGFDASIPMEAQSYVEPISGPVELLATINGTQFRLLAENLSRERVFGKSTLRVSGRGRNAILDAPYAPTLPFQNNIDRTAQQLAGDALTYNGVPMPWSVQWGLTDWLVPAGTWTHQGTHISALNAIAQAAGGYLQPHRTDQTLRILPKYPVAPWNWGSVTPDFELPADVTVRESIQWAEKPAYNRVFVSGQQTGVLGQVTRQGTAGDLVAQMVTDPLITHADAARQRGIAILGDTGRIATVGLSLPVLAETGIIEVGKFVRYVDGGETRLGIVRSTGVSVNGLSSVTQQLTVETHE